MNEESIVEQKRTSPLAEGWRLEKTMALYVGRQAAGGPAALLKYFKAVDGNLERVE